jgi:hypothetical protein
MTSRANGGEGVHDSVMDCDGRGEGRTGDS